MNSNKMWQRCGCAAVSEQQQVERQWRMAPRGNPSRRWGSQKNKQVGFTRAYAECPSWLARSLTGRTPVVNICDEFVRLRGWKRSE